MGDNVRIYPPKLGENKNRKYNRYVGAGAKSIEQNLGILEKHRKIYRQRALDD